MVIFKKSLRGEWDGLIVQGKIPNPGLWRQPKPLRKPFSLSFVYVVQGVFFFFLISSYVKLKNLIK